MKTFTIAIQLANGEKVDTIIERKRLYVDEHIVEIETLIRDADKSFSWESIESMTIKPTNTP